MFISLVIHNSVCFVLFTVKAYKYLYNTDNILQFVLNRGNDIIKSYPVPTQNSEEPNYPVNDVKYINYI
jgi:hypothetical protein